MTATQIITRIIPLLSAGFFLMLTVSPAKAQFTTTVIQQLNFGTFCPVGASGSITISPAGVRTVAGDIITINQNSALYMQAIVEVEAPIGSRLTIVNSNTQLRGSNGGAMTLHINSTDPVSSVITTTSKTNISIGGTLMISNMTANPSGKYSGSFDVTFIIE
ncbi:DUF4402 domain-containing protein [Pedobacter hartonius]|nr:DUF4402 domain-containing protein [Pedobacter hartonius]